ncbi:MAG: DNA-3-methyladenine glycosylase [bacterium]
MEYRKLEKSFYTREDTLKIARELLGKYLFTDIGGKGITGGMIVETEAYLGAADKASHGYNNRRTKRNENLYKEGGNAYVYFCYGMYHLFNVVTGAENTADAVLIRAIEPETGIDLMLKRKLERTKNNKRGTINKITSGPGLLSIALGIDLRHNGIPICENKNNGKNDKLEIWLEDRGIFISEKDIAETARIGVSYAAEHALLPWRFKIKPGLYTLGYGR